MDKNEECRNIVMSKKEKTRLWLLVGCIALMIFFGLPLVTCESPENWKEAEVTLTEVRHVSIKPNLWKITDTDGNTYSMYQSDEFMKQIAPRNTYQIMYSPRFNNGIRAMTQGDRVIIDYERSVSVYSERSIWNWILGAGGFGGSVAMFISTCREICKKTNRKRQPD